MADDQTPPVRLEATLSKDLGVPVSILNTGHLGYSPEQYYYSLIEYFDRFRPQFVVISLCANDFGDMKVEESWRESEYWMDLIAQFCRTRHVQYLFVPLPVAINLIGMRNEILSRRVRRSSTAPRWSTSTRSRSSRRTSPAQGQRAPGRPLDR